MCAYIYTDFLVFASQDAEFCKNVQEDQEKWKKKKMLERQERKEMPEGKLSDVGKLGSAATVHQKYFNSKLRRSRGSPRPRTPINIHRADLVQRILRRNGLEPGGLLRRKAGPGDSMSSVRKARAPDLELKSSGGGQRGDNHRV